MTEPVFPGVVSSSIYGPPYPKIETFFKRDNVTFKVATGDPREPAFYAVSGASG